MQNLDISDNVIVSLDKTSLRDLGVISLVQLNASRNYISDIEEEAFLGQSKLQTVDLSSNSLMIIETKTFTRNPSLDILSLSSNQYLRLPEEGPFLLSKSLRVLKLSDCNFYYLPPETFQELPNLQELYISHNKFEVLDSVPSAGGLAFLDVSHNYLTDLQSDIFTALPQLTHLNLSYNRFRTLNMTVMSQLAKMSNSTDLNGNPWVCDCIMYNTIYSWCRDNSVDLVLVCSSPPEFKDKSWSNCENSCVDFNTDVTDKVGEVIMMAEQKLSVKEYEDYVNPIEFYSSEKQIQGQKTEYDTIYAYVSYALFVVFLSLLIAVAIFVYRLKSRLSQLKRSAQGYSEVL
jgi:Leucine-rich repeat (LRR) protein